MAAFGFETSVSLWHLTYRTQRRTDAHMPPRGYTGLQHFQTDKVHYNIRRTAQLGLLWVVSH